MSGWFSVKRGITTHPLFKGHPERLAIWIWLLDNAVWKDTPHDIKGATVTVKRGSVAVSERRLAREVGVGYQVVRTFLGRLKDEHMINAEITRGRSVITLCNWEKYQTPPEAGNAPDNARLTQDQRTKEQGNNSVSKDTGQSPDPTKVVFDAGSRLIAATGRSVVEAKKIIGKWRQAHSDEAIISAIGRAQREGAVDPVAFIGGCLSASARAAEPKHGDTRTTPDGRRQVFQGGIGWMTQHV